jgi:hypothetical protein
MSEPVVRRSPWPVLFAGASVPSWVSPLACAGDCRSLLVVADPEARSSPSSSSSNDSEVVTEAGKTYPQPLARRGKMP